MQYKVNPFFWKNQIFWNKSRKMFLHFNNNNSLMSVSKRIKLIIEGEKRQKDFAEKTGLTSSLVSLIVTKEPESVTSATLIAILDAYPNINPTWLLLGQGNMYLTEEEQAAYSQAQDPAGGAGDKMTERVIDLLEKRVAELEREIKRRDPDLAREIGIE